MQALSGGQKTRLGLARLLLSQPDLLVLDEPTNHLDISALAWLEEFLAGYPGAVLLVSHDRAFLDRTVTTILALDDVTHTLREYPGNYSDYALAMDRSLEKQWATYQEQQERMERLTSSIRKLSGRRRTSRTRPSTSTTAGSPRTWRGEPWCRNAGWSACWRARRWSRSPA